MLFFVRPIFVVCVLCLFFLRFVCCVESSRGEDRSVDLVFLVCNFSFCVGVCVSASFLLALYRLWRADGG